MKLHTGATRHVILFLGWAIKVPAMHSWKSFLQGLLANMQERQFSRAGWPELCPVLWSVPGGWLLVMARAKPLTPAQWSDFRPTDFCDTPGYTVPAEPKYDSFGVVGGRIVAVDYGS
jgi:hypothetical protein